ncbi:MAG: PEGA domain-containing protein [Terriglobales bacterium]|jgi:serine/threonine-protein kinase
MTMMFGRFEIHSELSKSETALIYKAVDMETNQIVALKTQSLAPLGDRAEAFVETLITEGESTRDLAGQNIVLLYGAGEIDGQYCAAMEYIQGNSIATMLARKEGFSIWDLLDITRQVCAGLEHAASKNVTHCSLEPGKIMVQWDGMVKILGYGISNMSLIEAESGKGLGRLMPYCSPEQIRGEAIDLRSNVFTLGTILYEMVVGRQAFDAADPVTLVSRIESEMPASPASVNSKIQPAVSALIMKALAKDPAERYQSARELVDELENCKENGKKPATDSKKTPSSNVSVSRAARAAAASKFIPAASSTARPEPSASSSVAPVAPKPVAPKIDAPVFSPAHPPAAETRAAAAAAGGSGLGLPGTDSGSDSDLKSGARFISDFEVSAPESQAGCGPVLSAAVAEQESERQSTRVAFDPMMAEPAAGLSGKSFSDLAEMPPLKEPVFTPPVAEPAEALRPEVQVFPKKHPENDPGKEDKPRIQPRQVAEMAFKEISTIPSRLMLYSMLGAVGVILVVAIAVFVHVHFEDDGSTAAPRPTKAANSAQPVAQTPVAPRIEKPAPPVAPVAEAKPSLKVRPIEPRSSKSSRRASAPAPAPAPAAITGQELIDSSPQGAQFQVDGNSDPSWVTPFTLMGLSPGKHIIYVSKSGYASEMRSVDVAAGSKSSLLLHLSPVNALVVVNSTPPGADVIIDGRSTGRVTPVQFAVEKGSHTVLVRKQGYLDETVTADLGPAQNFQYSPVLRALGNTADMRTVGKLNKLFGHGGDSTAGMGSISIRTQPKGAQVAINQQVLDKTSPVDVMLAPGNYIVDVTLTGFKPVHKIVSVDSGGKAAINEILARQ